MGLWRIMIETASSDQDTKTTADGQISATASITATGVGPVPVENTNQFSGFSSIKLSGWGGGVLFRPSHPDGDRTVSSYEDPLLATLGISDTGTFLTPTGHGSDLEYSGFLRLGIGMSIRVDPSNPRYAYVMTTASAAYAPSQLTGMGVEFGGTAINAQWSEAPGGQRPVKTIELLFHIVE